MKALLVLLLIGLAAVGTGFRGWFSKYKAPPTAPYLADVSKQARREYFKIMYKNKTIAELDKEFDEWAKKYKIEVWKVEGIQQETIYFMLHCLILEEGERLQKENGDD